MSEGPIRQWREAHKPSRVSTSAGVALHLAGESSSRAYCGHRNPTHVSDGIRYVDCSACTAAYQADAEMRGET